MNLTFLCSNCSKTLVANERAAGREIVCPYCRKVTTAPRLSELRADDEEEKTGATEEREYVDPRSERAAAALTPSLKGFNIKIVEGGDFPYEAARQADVDAMRTVCPDFQPNPFCFDYPPFEEASKGVDLSEFEEEKQDAPSEMLDDPDYVDKLIAGFGED